MTKRSRKSLGLRSLEAQAATGPGREPDFIRTLIAATSALTALPASADAQEKHFFAEAAYSTAVHDRGEQIGAAALEAVVGAEMIVGDWAPFFEVYRRTPVGRHRHVFEGETDYVLGVVAEQEGFAASFAANWLTYPGEAAEPSLEWTAAIEFAHPLAPTLGGFYDADSGDAGFEMSVGSEWQDGAWTTYAALRAGFVHPRGGASRSYAGIELGAARQVSPSASFGVYIRGDVADEDAFARRFDAAGVTKHGNSGIAAGVGLTLAH
jgi:hypothetical protein